jgi:S1-C subfamily serine protease
MERGLLPLRVLFAATIVLLHTGVSSVAAQNTREGIITSFAPVVEKVAPSVVTVFTTQIA